MTALSDWIEQQLTLGYDPGEVYRQLRIAGHPPSVAQHVKSAHARMRPKSNVAHQSIPPLWAAITVTLVFFCITLGILLLRDRTTPTSTDLPVRHYISETIKIDTSDVRNIAVLDYYAADTHWQKATWLLDNKSITALYLETQQSKGFGLLVNSSQRFSSPDALASHYSDLIVDGSMVCTQSLTGLIICKTDSIQYNSVATSGHPLQGTSFSYCKTVSGSMDTCAVIMEELS